MGPAGADLLSLGLEKRELGPDLILEMIEMVKNIPGPPVSISRAWSLRGT